MVPPVWPRPRPLSLATGTPQLATSGTRISETLSPTPPVECLPTLVPGTSDRSMWVPEWSIASVSAAASAADNPFRYAAIKNALIW